MHEDQQRWPFTGRWLCVRVGRRVIPRVRSSPSGAEREASWPAYLPRAKLRIGSRAQHPKSAGIRQVGLDHLRASVGRGDDEHEAIPVDGQRSDGRPGRACSVGMPDSGIVTRSAWPSCTVAASTVPSLAVATCAAPKTHAGRRPRGRPDPGWSTCQCRRPGARSTSRCGRR